MMNAMVHAAQTRSKKLAGALAEIADTEGAAACMAESALEHDAIMQAIPVEQWREPLDYMARRIFELETELSRLREATRFVSGHLRKVDEKSSEDGFLDGASEPVYFVFEALPQYADRLDAALAKAGA